MNKLVKPIYYVIMVVAAFIPAQAKEVELDRVAAIVNNGVVLESSVQELIDTVKSESKKNNQELPSDNALRVQVMDKLISDELLQQLGNRMGIQVSDAQLDETIMSIAKDNNVSLDEFRKLVISEGMSYEKYRETIRVELISGEVSRAAVQRRVFISPQEVENLIEMMVSQTDNAIEYNLGHILIAFPSSPTQDDMNAAKVRADKVIELLNSGSDFAKIAIASSGDKNALSGGDLGWKNINEMPTLFSELVDGKSKGDVLGPIRTGLGYSIIKIINVRGELVVEIEEVKARHILITPSIILSDAKAEKMLNDFLAQIEAGEADFAEIAKEYSDGPTSVNGGELGWADPQNYDPAFKEALASLKVGEYHKAFRSSFGWHIVQLEDRRILDATSQMNENKARQMLFGRKFDIESERWLKEIKDQAYIEIFDLGNDK